MFFQTFTVCQEGRVPAIVPERKATQVGLCGGGIRVDEEKVLELGTNDPAFSIGVAIPIAIETVFLRNVVRKPKKHSFRLYFGEYCGPAIAFSRSEERRGGKEWRSRWAPHP